VTHPSVPPNERNEPVNNTDSDREAARADLHQRQEQERTEMRERHDRERAEHGFVQEFSAESPYCGAMVTDAEGCGDTCGLTREQHTDALCRLCGKPSSSHTLDAWDQHNPYRTVVVNPGGGAVEDWNPKTNVCPRCGGDASVGTCTTCLWPEEPDDMSWTEMANAVGCGPAQEADRG
jgi:hypothetical protein